MLSMCSLSYSPSSPGPWFEATPIPRQNQSSVTDWLASYSIVRSTCVSTSASLSAEKRPTMLQNMSAVVQLLTAMESQVVTCDRCNTPHHRDCWEFNRRCSTYGCFGETFHERGGSGL